MMRTIACTRVLLGLGVLVLAAGCGDDSSGSGGGGGEGTTSGETSAETVAAVTVTTATTATATSTGSGEGGSGEGGSGEGGSGEGGSGEGGAAVGNWECLADPPDAPEFENGPAATIEVRVREFLVDEGIADITVKVCEYTDAACADPTDEGITDADGLVELDVPTNSRHYLEASGGDLATTLSFPNGPVADGATIPFQILTTEELDQFIDLAGGDAADPERGHIGVSALDCDFVLAPGVEFAIDTADEDTIFGYFSAAGFPTEGGTETTEDGRAGIANVPVGEATVTGTVAADDAELGTRTVLVRAGAVSYADGVSPVPIAIE
jgi:hypothetical protein